MTQLKEDIIRLREQGKTYNQIKDELNCSKGTIAYHVGEGQKEKSRGRMAKRRKDIFEYVSEYKESIGCIDCGEKYPYFVLHFDHLGDKEFNISRYRQEGYSLDKIKKEIEKCEVVCANCHSIRTHSRSKRKYR